MRETVDVLVVGGGPAGLAGALALGRARRSVLVVDAGQPRNAPAAHAHNVLGQDGSSPREILTRGRAEVGEVGVRVQDGRVVSATAQPGGGFAARLADGTEVHARRLLVATGGVDQLPTVPGVRERWGRDVVHCPYCHGWEVRDQAVGVLATSPLAVHQALMWRQWTADVVLFVHEQQLPGADELEQLAARGIRLVEGVVASLEVTDDALSGVRLVGGEVVPRAVVVAAGPVVAQDDVLVSLGLVTEDVLMAGQVLGRAVPASDTGATAVPGVWVAGNVTAVNAQVVTSMAAGLWAGAQVNADLIGEDTRLAVEAARAARAA
ncbi:NAD(P)/FAD-dependent oxidoreductase [Modestobacter sp. Leaf380]|uniref:NAD(P)/FAD-dependent oxidoreductase n=1 Tax=Modestobacter sp. Leaf380 TaxID=1736356 RepID=UPI0006FB25E7|nr:NAD(P)/FAD-dependent oxidoreductase [Modestobacter sp. Leaf380]KQS68643.1 thioredoxin reductase [Modestobacter sp. Leaf380]